jgi:hypothetical protein
MRATASVSCWCSSATDTPGGPSLRRFPFLVDIVGSAAFEGGQTGGVLLDHRLLSGDGVEKLVDLLLELFDDQWQVQDGGLPVGEL